MSIRRYKPEADTTITNAYKGNLTTRATGSNMGESDVLEAFNIYAQSSSTSSEQSRILIKFPTTGISADRPTTLPAAGSVNFYLKLYNVPHGETLPTNFDLEVSPLTTAWDEGHGLDMEEYSDMGVSGNGNTFGGTGASWTSTSSGVNWAAAGGDYDKSSVLFHFNGNSTESASSGVVTAADTGTVTHSTSTGAFSGGYVTIPGATTNYITVSSSAGSNATDSLYWDAAFTVDFWFLTPDNTKDNLVFYPSGWTGMEDGGIALIRFGSSDGMEMGINRWDIVQNGPDDHLMFVDNPTIADDTWYHIGITRSSAGLYKMFQDGVLLTEDHSEDNPLGAIEAIAFPSRNIRLGGHPAGDLSALDGTFSMDEFRILKGTAETFSAKPTQPYTVPVTASFEDGDEDLDIDITSIVESWIDGSVANHGLVVKLTSATESGTTSLYTKKFSARNSEYFFNRPVIEARWDSSEKDDRNNFYLYSNLRSDNNNTISIKNYIDGTLTNIPAITGGNDMDIAFYPDSDKGTPLSITKAVTNPSAGIYKAVVALPSDFTGSSVYVEWQDEAGTPIIYHTETIYVKQRSAAIANIPEYVTTIQNLKKVYSNDEMARFRLFIRSKDWSPTIYTVATTELKSEVVADAYYKVMRVVDDFTVIDYGSGDVPHTKLSYDENGPYFDFDMSMLETGWAYRIELMYKINGEMRQQPEAFKFRVVE